MRKIKWTIETAGLRLSQEELQNFTLEGQKSLFENNLTSAMASKYPQIDSRTRKSHARILAALDSATTEEIEVEEAEYELLKSVFCSDDAKFHPGHTRVITQYVTAIENAK